MDLVIVVGLVSLVGLLLYWLNAQQHPTPARGSKSRAAMESLDTVAAWPPQATRILTMAERQAFGSLKAGLPDHIVLAQVPLSRFMKVPTRNSYAEWLRRVGLMSVDLVVCDASSHVIGVVDIRAADGRENERARQRHARMDKVLEAAGIPVHVWHEDGIPSASAAREAILGRSASQPAPAPEHPPRKATAPRRPEAEEAPGQPVEPDLLLDAEHPDDLHHPAHPHRDPPPSTWFDNLDSDAMPLQPGPPQRSAPQGRDEPPAPPRH
jgi:hypothetical protein